MKTKKYRYLVCYLDPKSGRERLGTGADAQTFAYYVSVENVIRYHISHVNFPPGQYHIYSWPEGGKCSDKPIYIAYKKAGKNS